MAKKPPPDQRAELDRLFATIRIGYWFRSVPPQGQWHKKYFWVGVDDYVVCRISWRGEKGSEWNFHIYITSEDRFSNDEFPFPPKGTTVEMLSAIKMALSAYGYTVVT
jgi:hypothetical protein